ncbi:MAG: DEAD/DEAH box helicase, partial [Deltaproteobacteria bacterium]|nr:DEAD/DEAH box helicase [Deltaproteobacteria bacterium]
ERCLILTDETSVPTRGNILSRLALLTLTDNERVMHASGLKSRRQVMEDSFWFRFAYHGYREFGQNGCLFHGAVDETSGMFFIKGENSNGDVIFTLEVPRRKVKRVLNALKNQLSNQHGVTICPVPLDTIFDVRMNKDLDLEIRQLIRVIQKKGEVRFFDRKDLKKYQYGDLYYIPELNILTDDSNPGRAVYNPNEPVTALIKRSQVPEFLTEHGEDLKQEGYRLDKSVRKLEIINDFDSIEVTPQAMDREWCWLSIQYGAGNHSISLADILRAQKEGERFMETDTGWIDCRSPEFKKLSALIHGGDSDTSTGKPDQVKLSRLDLLKMRAFSDKNWTVKGDRDRVRELEQLFDGRTMHPMPAIKGMISALRPYQQIGAEWLWFLHENRFGGLLCDDMGLGKTHQVMAFLLGLAEQDPAAGPFLVISPTTVLSHWHRKISEHAPTLKAAVYHGGQRDLAESLDDHPVILTSYGILRMDIAALKKIRFQVVVFDEIQFIKNSATQAYHAAENLDARIKLGLTGTPIENSIGDLKALMDLSVPGYLGTTDAFNRRYVDPIEQDTKSSRRGELSRLISPFTLRRLKKTVLKDLPDKIENQMACRLSEDQIKLYRDALASRGSGLLEVLGREDEPVPYLHVFALLNLLKQICNHPALLEKDVEEYTRYESGKWDLFQEILTQSLESGQKVVVYSQYLKMIDIIGRYLEQQQIAHVALTGASRNRGHIIARFNDDPDCRVFVGSLKAGGTGIDLVAASVVIHYDRWWNAAREDQATDRVHRIGQKKGVHIFKLVTEGTLEEKIAAIIEKKKNIMDAVMVEDDPGLLKTFSRKQLMEMLSIPVSAENEK